MIRLSVLCSLLFAINMGYAATLRVPADQPTIQAAIIDGNGDRIAVIDMGAHEFQ